MNASEIEAALRGTCFRQVEHFAEIDSTNTYLLQEAQAGSKAGRVAIADMQTAGRGRGGHTWNSAAVNGLYMSVLLRPHLRGDDALLLSLVTGLAVQQGIAEVVGVRIDIRWPNDLVVQQAAGPSLKCGGILTETAMHPDGSLRHAVIGIGINVNHKAMPPEIAETATSLRITAGMEIPRQQIAVAILLHLSHEIAELEASEDHAGFLRRFEQSSRWARGLRVHVAEDEGYTGVTDGLDPRGMLRVRLPDGTLRTPRHGGVREAE